MLDEFLLILCSAVLFFNSANAVEDDIYESSQKAGLIAVPHDVVTDDGYILTIFLIKEPSESDENVYKKEPVLVLHGLTGSAEHFTGAQNESLAFFLCKKDFSVWLGNARGSFHSLRHKTLDPQGQEFWQFTLDQHGKYDLPAMLDYVLKITKRKNLSFVGHSQGSAAFFAMAAGGRSDYNSKVKIHLALAPAVYLKNTQCPLFLVPSIDVTIAKEAFESYKIYSVPAIFDVPLIKIGADLFCGKYSPLKQICLLFLAVLEPVEQSLIEMDYISAFVHTQPAGFSVYQILHYAQMTATGAFSRFDWGSTLNLKYHNSVTATPYDLSKVTTPIAIIYGKNDVIIDKQDVDRLADELPNLVEHYAVDHENFTHLDFLVGKNLSNLLNQHILDVLNKYRN